MALHACQIGPCDNVPHNALESTSWDIASGTWRLKLFHDFSRPGTDWDLKSYWEIVIASIQIFILITHSPCLLILVFHFPSSQRLKSSGLHHLIGKFSGHLCGKYTPAQIILDLGWSQPKGQIEKRPKIHFLSHFFLLSFPLFILFFLSLSFVHSFSFLISFFRRPFQLWVTLSPFTSI